MRHEVKNSSRADICTKQTMRVLAGLLSTLGLLSGGMVASTAFAEGGYAYQPAFVATGSNYFDVSDPADPSTKLETFTIASWFKTSQWVWKYDFSVIAVRGGFEDESAGYNVNYGIWMTKLEKIGGGFETANGTNYFIETNRVYNDGLWHYAVLTYDGQTLALYVDAERKGRIQTAALPDINGNLPLRAAADPVSSTMNFEGEIDEVRVWNRALSAAEIADQYNSGVFDTAGQVAYMDAGGSSGQVNEPPSANAGSDFSIPEQTENVLLEGSGQDADGVIVSYAWEQIQGPAVTLINADSAVATFNAPSVTENTDLVFKLTVTDDKADSSSDTVAVTVTNANSQPLANAGSDQTVNEGAIVTLDGRASSDPDGDALTYSWSQTAGPAVTLSDSTAAMPTFTAPLPDYDDDITLTFELRVSDGTTVSTDTIDVIVLAPNDAIAPTGQLTINAGDVYTKTPDVQLTLACSDAESGCQEMMLSVDGIFDTETFEPFALTKNVILPLGDETKTVKAIFKDAAGNASPEASDTIILDSTAPNAPMISDPANGSTITSNSPVFSGSSEPNSAIKLFDGSNLIASASANSAGSWSATPTSSFGDGTHSIKATATDNAGNTSPYSATVNITVDTSVSSNYVSSDGDIVGGTGGLRIAPQDDKTLTTTGSSARVALGRPLVTVDADWTPSIQNDALSQGKIPAGAIAYWSFDNNLNDASGNNNHGTASDDAIISNNYIGKALVLDGHRDYVTAKDSSSLRISGAFSISVWVKLDTLSPANGDYVRILEKGSVNKYWMYYVKSSKQVGFGFKTQSGDYNVATNKVDWQAGKWYHIVGTFDPALTTNNMKIFVNGILDKQITKGVGVKPVVSSDPLRIGAKYDGGWDYWDGAIDELQIYKRAISATEAKDLFNAPFISLPPGTNVITWKVTDDSGKSDTAVQVVNVVSSSATHPTTSLSFSGQSFTSSNGAISVTPSTDLKLSIESSNGLQSTYYRYYLVGVDDKPSFSTGQLFRLPSGNGQYAVQFYSIDSAGNREPLREKQITVDSIAPSTSVNLVDNYAAGNNFKITVADGANTGSFAQAPASGIYYKIDSSASYTFIKSSTVSLPSLTNGWHTITYYAVDNLGNSEAAKTTKFNKFSSTFCASNCDFSHLQTAVNALPAGGGKIYIGSGHYVITYTTKLKSGTAIEFSAGSSVYFRGNAIPVFAGSGVSNVQITGGNIDIERQGVKVFSFTSGSNAIKVSGTVAEQIKGGNSAGFFARDSTDIEVSNVNFKTASRLIDIQTSTSITDGKSARIWIQNSTFADASIEGIKINYSNDVHIIGNTVTDTNENGIDIGSNKGTEVRGNTMVRVGYPTNGVGIHTDHADGADLIDNYIDTTGQSGIAIYRASNIKAIGNTIKNTVYSGITVTTGQEPSKYVLIQSNHIVSVGKFGIYVSPNQVQVEIAYNTVEKAASGGIVVGPNNSTTKVHDNTVIT